MRKIWRLLALALVICLMPIACVSMAEEAEKEPVTLSILAPLGATTPNGVHDNEIINALRDETGVTIDWIIKESINDWANYYGVMLASGDLPDIVTLQLTDDKYRGDIFAANAALPLDDLIAEYGPNIQENGAAMMDLMRGFKSNNGDGKLYFLGVGGDAQDMAYGFDEPWGTWFARWDIYQAIGAPEITSDEDLLNVMKLMQEYYPETEDGKKTYGLSGFFAESNQFGCWYPECTVDAAMGWMWVNCGPMFFNNNTENYTMTIYDDDSPWLRALRLHNKAYQMGLLDPESFTMTLTQYTEKCAAGRILVPQVTWAGGGMFNTTMNNEGNYEAGYAPINYPYNLGQETPSQAYAYYPGGWQCYFISTNCKAPERAIELFNYTFSEEGMELLYNGLEGVHWYEEDGVYRRMPEITEGFQTDTDFGVKTGIAKYTNLCAFSGSVLNKNGVTYDYGGTKEVYLENMTQFKKNFSADIGAEYPAQPWMDEIEPIDATYYNYISIGDDEDLVEIQARVNTHMDIWAPQLCASKTDEEFDKKWQEFKEGMDNIGYATLYEKSVEALDAARAVYTPETGFVD